MSARNQGLSAHRRRSTWSTRPWTVVAFLACVWGCSRTRAPAAPVFIPAPPAKPRLQVLMSFTSERDLHGGDESGWGAALLGKQTKASRRLSKPYGAIFRRGKLYVADTGLATVVIVDLVHRRFSRLAGDSGMGKLKLPINIASDGDGNLYVTDARRRQVLVYDPQDRFLRAIGDGKSFKPSGIAIRDQELYVTDITAHQVVALALQTGNELRRMGGPGRKLGEFSFPANVAVDAEGYLYVSEALGGRVQKLSPAGVALRQFGTLGKSIGELVRPKGLAVDPQGNLYVADAASEHVQVFDKDGHLLLFFGGRQGGLGPGSLYLPAGLHISDDYESLAVLKDHVAPGFVLKYLVVVVSQYGPRKITIFGFIQPSRA